MQGYNVIRVGALRIVFPILIGISAVLSSCTAPCDYPTVRVAMLRLVNAMPDQDNITVWLNGRQFKTNYPYNIPLTNFTFGYNTQFQDGSPLSVGKFNVLVTSASDTLPEHILMRGTMNLNLDRSTLVVMGRAHTETGDNGRRQILLLDDQTPSSWQNSNYTYIRFIHAIPDLPTLEIDTNGTFVNYADYGVASPYTTLQTIQGLKISDSTNASNVIANFQYAFTSTGFVVTALCRGRTSPLGDEHTASVFLLSDEPDGNEILTLQTFGVRIANISRSTPQVTLLIQSPTDSSGNKGPRSNYPQQDITVTNINVDTVSAYLGLNPSLNSRSTYYVSSTANYTASTLLDSVIINGAVSDNRYTIVALDSARYPSSGSQKLDHLVLVDTMTMPADAGYTRLRIVNGNPDHKSITVTIGSATATLAFKQVAYFDVPVGSVSIGQSDGSASVSTSFTAIPIRPYTIYLLPAEQNGNFLVKAYRE